MKNLLLVLTLSFSTLGLKAQNLNQNTSQNSGQNTPPNYQGQYNSNSNFPNKPTISPEERANKRTKMLTKRLNLSPEQSEKIYTIILSQVTNADQIRDNSNGDIRQMRQNLHALGENTDAKLSGVLSQDQEKAYEDFKMEQKNRIQQLRQNGAGNGSANRPNNVPASSYDENNPATNIPIPYNNPSNNPSTSPSNMPSGNNQEGNTQQGNNPQGNNQTPQN